MTIPTERKTFKDQLITLKNVPKFFRLIWATNRWLVLANLFLRLIKANIPILVLFVSAEIIDEIIHLINTPNQDRQYLWTLVGIELALAVASDLINRCITLIDSLLGDLFSNKTSEDLIRKAATLDLYQFEDAKFYDKLERARRQTNGRTILMTQILTQLQESITIVSLGIGLVAFNPWLILILFIAIIPSFIGETHFNERSYSLSRSWTPQRRELDYIRFIGASDRTAKEVKIFGLAGFLANRFKLLAAEYYTVNKRLATKRAFWGVFLSAIGTLSYYGAYVFIIIQTVNGHITLGRLTFLAGSFRQMRGMLQSIMNRFSKITEGALYLQDLFDFFDIKPNIRSLKNSQPFPKKVQHGFTFENVSFSYPGSSRKVLNGVSFHLPAGKKLALVGVNGAGKTTLVKLLARLYEPSSGRILVDGIDIKEIDLLDLRDNIGIIFQDFVRFQLKVYENIAIGNINQLNERPDIEDAATKSLANLMIKDLPEQYEQMLGRRFENGVELSGGQWQKVALARAYMREAQLLILDEPTSALDARAEHDVFLRFSELIEDRSAVLISHRFSTVRMADIILFLEDGKIIEMGSHEELLTLDGRYAELFKLQAKGYQ